MEIRSKVFLIVRWSFLYQFRKYVAALRSLQLERVPDELLQCRKPPGRGLLKSRGLANLSSLRETVLPVATQSKRRRFVACYMTTELTLCGSSSDLTVVLGVKESSFFFIFTKRAV